MALSCPTACSRDLGPPGVSFTYIGRAGSLSWGGQMGGTWKQEDSNESGYAQGEKYYVSGWSAWGAVDWLSLSVRLAYQKEGDIDGHYDGFHAHSSPPNFQANYGGEFVDLGLGINAVAQTGPLVGVRLGLEWLLPLEHHYNGFQLGREQGPSLSLTYAL